MQKILDEDSLAKAQVRLADEIERQCSQSRPLALIGVRSRGDVLACRLRKLLSQKSLVIDFQGVLDITLYRDDLDSAGHQARVRATEIEFDITDCVVILVDDVIYTGRTARAGLDALTDLGRPKAIRLAVLIDRGGRELPIQPDFVGLRLPDAETHAQVLLEETDGEDKIILQD